MTILVPQYEMIDFFQLDYQKIIFLQPIVFCTKPSQHLSQIGKGMLIEKIEFRGNLYFKTGEKHQILEVPRFEPASILN
jgi:hypothetical protein